MSIGFILGGLLIVGLLLWPFLDYWRRRRQINAEKAPEAAIKRARETNWDEDDWDKKDQQD